MSIDTPAPKPEPAGTGETETRFGLIDALTSIGERLGLVGSKTLRDTLEHALKTKEGQDKGTFSDAEREMLVRLLRFGNMRVDDLMVPRADIIAIDESEPLRELITTFEEAGVSRVPVFHETLDDPRGMVHIKDLFRWLASEASGRELSEPRIRASSEKPHEGVRVDAEALRPDYTMRLDLTRPISAAKIRRPVLFVPPSMPAMNLLVRMQTTRNHMALVVDEYGGTDGLVTIEDLVEQIVGDIEDEHDETEAALLGNDPKLGLVASGRAPVKELEARLGLALLKPDEVEDVDTVGGLVVHIAGHVPARGEMVRHASGVEFEVLDADPRRVKKLRVHRPKPADGSDEAAAASPSKA
jgi:CBS domain containing-hemolysin-like protein